MEKLKAWLNDAKQKVVEKVEAGKVKAKEIKKYFDENPEKFGACIGALVTLALPIGGAIISFAGNDKESCKIHDDTIGSYWLTDHPLTNQELLEVNRKLFDGQCASLGEALQEEGYLKKEKRRK